MKIAKKIISSFVVSVLLVSFCSSFCFAAIVPSGIGSIMNVGNEIVQAVGFWDVIQNIMLNDDYQYSGFVDTVDAIFSRNDSGCSSSLDGNHLWETDLVAGAVYGIGLWDVHCRYCGANYQEYKTGTSGYLTSDDMEDVYSDYVSDLPATGYTSTGGLLWSPSHSVAGFSFNTYGNYWSCPHSTGVNDFRGVRINSDCNSMHYIISPDPPSNSSFWLYSYYFNFEDTIPLDGFYRRIQSPMFDFNYIDSNGSIGSSSSDYSADSGTSYFAGDTYTSSFSNNYYRQYFKYHDCLFYSPIYEVTPLPSASQSISNTYNTNTRTTSIQGDLAYYDVSGTLNLSPSTSIVNENDNSVYNPVTNTTTDISGWSYDYSTRTYDLSTTTGDTITVTYGDENITINEGGETYNVYYVTQYQEPPAHVHNYVGTVTTQPTCTTTGVKTYTCAADGDTYTETVPALGHDWQIKTQVQTEYDHEGVLVQQGYTIYKCSRCGEEYRSDDSVNPSPPSTAPPSGGGGGDGGLSDYTSDKLSGFSRFWEIIVSFFTRLPEMFEDVTSFMVDAFPYIPEEVMYLIEFGIAMAVLVGIFKLVFR